VARSGINPQKASPQKGGAFLFSAQEANLYQQPLPEAADGFSNTAS